MRMALDGSTLYVGVRGVGVVGFDVVSRQCLGQVVDHDDEIRAVLLVTGA